MRHCRIDYDAIQPWPTQRRPTVKRDDMTVFDAEVYRADPPHEPIIPDDEPVFILRAKDVLGPEAVRHWAVETAAYGGDPAMCERVRRFADEMQAYAAEHYGGGKVADTPPEMLRP